MTEVNCKIHEYLCNHVLPHFCYQSLITRKDLIAVSYFSACNISYFIAITFLVSCFLFSANLNKLVTPDLNFFLQSFIVNMILITTLSSIEIKKYQRNIEVVDIIALLQIILHLYEIRSLTISIIYIFAPPCPKTRSLLFCFDVKLI